MAQVTIIGLDLAKNVFQAHGASETGAVAFRKKLTRNQVLPFLSEQPKCIVAMAGRGRLAASVTARV